MQYISCDFEDELAKTNNLQSVGVISIHSPRDKQEFAVSGKEILLSAKEQSIHGSHCVLITVSYDTKTKESEVCSWQISDQCVNLYQMETFLEMNNIKDDKILFTSFPLEITNDKKSITKSSSIDTHWFYAPIAIEQKN